MKLRVGDIFVSGGQTINCGKRGQGLPHKKWPGKEHKSRQQRSALTPHKCASHEAQAPRKLRQPSQSRTRWLLCVAHATSLLEVRPKYFLKPLRTSARFPQRCFASQRE